MNLPAPQFQTIPEQDEFLALFPHRHDYIWAEHPSPGETPHWQTESRHPLSDRQIQQGDHLYGARFGKETSYVLLDIDPQSPYHPDQDPFAIQRLIATLEPLGLIETVPLISSYRNGIHLYLPFSTPQTTWEIAQAISTLLETSGYKLKPGHLELFPNPKPYSPTPSLYNAHRLPLQPGSYLLNRDLQPIYSNHSIFVKHWTFAQNRNHINPKTLKRLLQKKQRHQRKLSGKAEKFLNDLNTEIEPGWTDSGQTNYLLGRIAMREYIFGHILHNTEPLTGHALAERICQIARSLPGFTEYCHHQTDLEQRAAHYARSIQVSHYYPFGYKRIPKPPTSDPQTPTPPTWNQQQAQTARDRIQTALTDLLNHNKLPTQTTARRNALKAYGIGNTTLDKNKDLWHPNHLKPSPTEHYHPLTDPFPHTESPQPLQDSEYHPIPTNKLVLDSAAPSGQAERDLQKQQFGGSGGFSTECSFEISAPVFPQMVETEQIAETRKTEKGIAKIQTTKMRPWLARMQTCLESHDPILVAAAQEYFAIPKPSLNEPIQEPLLNSTLQSEAADSEVIDSDSFLLLPHQSALAWASGLYNPLAGLEDTHARLLTPEEEDWLGLAKAVGWLLVEDELDAIVFTAPPPDFALEQADWYVRPDLTTFLEEPLLLHKVVRCYPISLAVIRQAIAQRVQQLGWSLDDLLHFIQDTLQKSRDELEETDWECLLFELLSQQD